MGSYLKILLALCIKEWRSLFGDRLLSGLIILEFTLMVVLAADVSADVNNAAVGVVDYDRSRLSRQIIDAVRAPHFQTPVLVSPDGMDDLLNSGQLSFVLVFPPNFERDAVVGRVPEIQLLIDASVMSQAGLGSAYLEEIIERELAEFAGGDGMKDLPVRAVARMSFNQNLENHWLTGTLEVGNVLALITLVLVGAAVIRERERGTLEHLLVLPVSASQIVLAKMLANGAAVCMAAVLSMKFVVAGVLNIPLAGPLGVYALGAGVFVFCVASLAVMLATITPTMPQYSLLMTLLYVIFLMFSGSMGARENMPQAAQWMSMYFPSTQFALFTQNVLVRDADWSVFAPQLGAMVLAAVLFLGLALGRFRKMLEKQV